MIKKLCAICMLVTGVLICTTCERVESIPTFTDQGNIGPEGGIVKTSDGASVIIPAGALSINKSISITNITEDNTFINNGCNVFELKPDGLLFSDSVTITLPFDDKYIDLYSKDVNYGVGILVFQDSAWVLLKTQVNLQNKTAQAKTNHFSEYYVMYPSIWEDYFLKNKGLQGILDKPLVVPYYYQEGKWCAYYALTMITKYAGYDYHAPFYASLMNEPNPESFFAGFTQLGVNKLDESLKELGIEIELPKPAWSNTDATCGYILMRLKEGYPVMVMSSALRHAFVVTGFDGTGFFINDSGGVVYSKISPSSFDIQKLAMIHVTYNEFKEMLSILGAYGTEWTVIIKSIGPEYKYGPTLNFHSGRNQICIDDIDEYNNHTPIGKLSVNGKYKPSGYSLINLITGQDGIFNGTDYIVVNPSVANSDQENDKNVEFHLKIDNIDAITPIITNCEADNSYSHIDYEYGVIKAQLSNLNKGEHSVSVELRFNHSLLSDH